MAARKRIEYGQYIVGDPEICHGQLTFKGTRIFVKDVLDMAARGWDWDRISTAWFGKISHEAIAEAIALAREALIEKTEKRMGKVIRVRHSGISYWQVDQQSERVSSW